VTKKWQQHARRSVRSISSMCGDGVEVTSAATAQQQQHARCDGNVGNMCGEGVTGQTTYFALNFALT